MESFGPEHMSSSSETPQKKNSVKSSGGVTPLMKQYLALKEQYPATVLLYRMGDFYELFGDDAKIASQILGLTLTKRNNGGSDDTPLAGFPHHALDRYANRLVRAGHKIAICEQVEDPKKAKGIVKRDVIEVISAGTATEDNYIDEKTNNFIASIFYDTDRTGLAICDLSTGQFWVEELSARELEEELARLEPTELVMSETVDESTIEHLLRQISRPVITRYDGWKYDLDNAISVLTTHFRVASVEGLGLDSYPVGIRAAGALLSYLKEQKKNGLQHISSVQPRYLGEYALLDAATIRNLELLRPLNAEDAEGTLLWTLDRTCTAMGGRLLRHWITHPLKDPSKISDRLDCVDWLRKDVFARGEIGMALRSVADIERLIGRIVFERANGRDLVSLMRSLRMFPRIIQIAASGAPSFISMQLDFIGGFDELADRIENTISENPPVSLREGNLIRPGVSAELDELRDASVNGKQWIANLQKTERERTGISSLKVGFNKVFGYYIEVSKANSAAVPEDYIRKQTLVNGERFITPDLKEKEEKILGAQERMADLEYGLFCELRAEVAKECERVQKAAEAIGKIDALVSLATVASENMYTRPVLDDSTNMMIRDGRHPVVEKMTGAEQFVPNDTSIEGDQTRILLITGPNMAGKSTYLRQNALIAIMAQMGSFVPAGTAEIGVVDRIFTRVGASDRLARGQSTFLVEMIEVANILNNATDRSLVLLDEVGRGTSTFDGISIAWAVAEYLHETPGRNPRTFFATHYHELTELASLFPRVRNLHVKVKEWNDRIIFVRKIAEGGCDHSYGIQVARLAGVPKDVIVRAKEILANLERMELTPDQKPALAEKRSGRMQPSSVIQTHLFVGEDSSLATPSISPHQPILDELKKIDVNAMTPLEALTKLAQLKKKLD